VTWTINLHGVRTLRLGVIETAEGHGGGGVYYTRRIYFGDAGYGETITLFSERRANLLTPEEREREHQDAERAAHDDAAETEEVAS
jgi:hypothetical protein